MEKSARLGQHFLINPGIGDRIVALVPPGREPLLEIGPGRGVLTRRLLERFPGRALTVVEKDPRLAAALQKELGDRAHVVASDILACRAADLAGREKIFLVGNIPYLISTPLLEWVLFQHESWSGGVMMTQDEFARRLMQASGPLPAALRAFFSLTPVMRVSPGSFNPPPKVFSRVFALAPRQPGIEPAAFHGFLKQCFFHPRRTLRNNLREHFPQSILDTMLEQLGIPSNTRAEAIPDPILLALFTRLSSPGNKQQTRNNE
ncbi:MAG TPA: ribosomal RNA small subunit methyltransferase A [Candidatus Aminicenantes bacterium]|nr:ribosomal RNA small subunit methyltransferase A [Candidatus Aminicenantes bacterium]